MKYKLLLLPLVVGMSAVGRPALLYEKYIENYGPLVSNNFHWNVQSLPLSTSIFGPPGVTYLQAFGPEANSVAAQLAQDFSYLGWSFGTGPATSGTITLDRRQAATLPGNYDWAGEYIVSRYTYAYPSPMVDPPNPRLQGIAGTHTVPVANLRWIVRLIPGPLYVGDNFKPIWQKNAAWLGVPPDGLPFYWTESEDQSKYTSGWDTRGAPFNPNFPVWFDKCLGLISKSPIELPQNKTLTPNPTTYLQIFLAEIHYSGLTASVQVLDGFQTRYYAKWNQSNPGPYVNPTFTPTSMTGG